MSTQSCFILILSHTALMFFWIRILIVLARACFRPKSGATDETTVSLRVWPHESEVFFANQAIYPHYLELARWDWAVRSGAGRLAIQKRILFILGGQTLLYRRPLQRFHRFDVRTKIIGWDERWFYFEQKIYSTNGQLAHSALVKACCKQGKNLVAPLQVLQWLDPSVTTLPPLPSSVLDWQKMERHLLKP